MLNQFKIGTKLTLGFAIILVITRRLASRTLGSQPKNSHDGRSQEGRDPDHGRLVVATRHIRSLDCSKHGNNHPRRTIRQESTGHRNSRRSLQNMTTMRETIQHCTRQTSTAQNLCPLLERQVRSDNHTRPLMSFFFSYQSSISLSTTNGLIGLLQ